MEELILFTTKEGYDVTNIELFNTLKKIKADECDILYVHSSLSFGVPNQKIRKKQLLQSLVDVLLALDVKTICMPTFTFSFCNGKFYDPDSSCSRMGGLNEYFRKQAGVKRSLDPLMSVALMGEDKELVEGIGHSSCGAGSTFDKLRHRNNVKFLFLGPKMGDCLTYMHYLEWMYSVDYRYERKFRGVVSVSGKESIEEYDCFVRYNGVFPNAASYDYEQRMYDNGTALITNLGDGTISIVDKDNATAEYKKCLDENPYFFVDFVEGTLVKDKTFVLTSEMVAM